MTTIAYKDGILAADSQLTLGDSTKITSDDKIRILNKVTIFAAAGNTNSIAIAEKFFSDPDWEVFFAKRPPELLEKDKDGEYEHTLDALLIFKGQVFLVDRFLIPDPLRHPFIAVGSGWNYAMAAMHTGLSAVDAVELASQFDIYTNNKIRWLDVKEFNEGSKTKSRRGKKASPMEAQETKASGAEFQGSTGGRLGKDE